MVGGKLGNVTEEQLAEPGASEQEEMEMQNKGSWS